MQGQSRCTRCTPGSGTDRTLPDCDGESGPWGGPRTGALHAKCTPHVHRPTRQEIGCQATEVQHRCMLPVQGSHPRCSL